MKTIRETVTRFLIVAGVASIAMIPMLLYGCGPEWARWDSAQANFHFRRGETDEALYQLRDAIGKSPRDPVLKLNLAQRLIEMDEPEEALDLANEVLDIYPENGSAIAIKCLSQQSQGDFVGALETQLEHDQKLDASQRGVSSYNHIAYFRGLAGKDLHLAKRDIESAVLTASSYMNWTGSGGLSLPVKATVLASLVARCCDREQLALETLTNQIDRLQTQIIDAQHKLTEKVYREAKDSFPIRQNVDILFLRKQLRLHETHAAMLLTCRALIYQDLGDYRGEPIRSTGSCHPWIRQLQTCCPIPHRKSGSYVAGNIQRVSGHARIHQLTASLGKRQGICRTRYRST